MLSTEKTVTLVLELEPELALGLVLGRHSQPLSIH
jgi:hypothetical protein